MGIPLFLISEVVEAKNIISQHNLTQCSVHPTTLVLLTKDSPRNDISYNFWPQFSFFICFNFHFFQDTKGTRKIARFSKSKYKDKDNNAKIDEKAFYANSVMGPLLSSKFVRPVTGKSLSETLIFELTKPQYAGRLFIELKVY